MKKFVRLPIILACSTYTSFAFENAATPANTPIETGEGLLKETGLNKVSKNELEAVSSVNSDRSFNSSPPIPIRNARKVEFLESDESATSSSVSSESPSKGGISSWLIKTTYKWVSDPETEKRRFPNLTLERLIELYGTQNGSWEKLIGKSFHFETISTEKGSDHYAGIAIIEEFDYGEVHHELESVEKGFRPTVERNSKRDKMTPKEFFDKLVKKNQNPEFRKGTPFKENDTKTRIDYTAYNLPKASKFITVRVRREQKF